MAVLVIPITFISATSVTARYVRLLYCKLPVVVIGLPIALPKPDNRNSTVRQSQLWL
jgi:hypothetical protein